ncbi:AbrB/MazE/SpoVT family DNA-binding domain-containing protein [Asticcacaulis biprosthecium]|uniref:AbrB/MazE/SpoVT family DNA-binding domain-containing protein n=1 Tax=Asticcacaulis biprosthecium TaxID=76891 RepID=UPI00067FCD44|nr:AbrB/MazE/SpoVT family DNA-binding domain-containing protein [Asticcacaulis biprosthecium]
MSFAIKVSNEAIRKEVKFRKSGGSYAITIPVSVADAARFSEGTIGDIVVADDGSLVIRHKAGRKKRYSLNELLQELPETFELTDEQRAWEQLPPVGNEI